MIRNATQRSVLLALFAVTMLSGCGGGDTVARTKEISHLRAITALYFKAASALGKNPASEQEFKDVIAQDKMDLGVLGVGSSDELFISDRDGQPLIVVYGQTPKGVAPGVVVYEQTGKDGIRLVGFKNGQIEEADAARFAELAPASSQ